MHLNWYLSNYLYAVNRVGFSTQNSLETRRSSFTESIILYKPAMQDKKFKLVFLKIVVWLCFHNSMFEYVGNFQQTSKLYKCFGFKALLKTYTCQTKVGTAFFSQGHRILHFIKISLWWRERGSCRSWNICVSFDYLGAVFAFVCHNCAFHIVSRYFCANAERGGGGASGGL